MNEKETQKPAATPLSLEAMVAQMLSQVKATKGKPGKASQLRIRKDDAEFTPFNWDELSPEADLNWKETALVLHLFRSTCACGAIHISPNAHILIERHHPKRGVHYASTDRLQALNVTYRLDLPRRIEYRETTIPFCHQCFLGATNEELTSWTKKHGNSHEAVPCTNPGGTVQQGDLPAN